MTQRVNKAVSTLSISSGAESQRPSPPRQLELPPPGAAEFVLCDHTIECFFRDAKQLLGLGRSQVREPQAVLTHLMLVGVAHGLLQLLKPLSPKPHISVSQSKKALLPLRLLSTTTGAVSLVRLTADGQYEPVEIEDLWQPIRTRCSGIELPEHLGFP